MRALFLVALFAVAALPVAVLDRAPLVSRDGSISPAALAAVRRVLASNDPRRLAPNEQRTAMVPVLLIDEAFNQLASRSLHGRGAFALDGKTGELRLSVPAPGLPGPLYLNLRATIAELDGQAHLVAASLGALPIPSPLARALIVPAIDRAGVGLDWQLAQKAIRRLAFVPSRGQVAITYVWQPALLQSVRSLLFTPADIRFAEGAQRRLAALLDRHPARAPVPLSEVLTPLLAGADGTPQQARAALLVLAAYVAETSLGTLLPQAGQWPRPRRLALLLAGRYDSAQHFVVSAALAAWFGEAAANAIVDFKEVEDSQYGSGFSFADLAVGRAGSRFGRLLVSGSPQFRETLRMTPADADLAPPLAGLPEYLSQAEFQRRYGGRDSAAYRQVSDDIEARLAALPLYR